MESDLTMSTLSVTPPCPASQDATGTGRYLLVCNVFAVNDLQVIATGGMADTVFTAFCAGASKAATLAAGAFGLAVGRMSAFPPFVDCGASSRVLEPFGATAGNSVAMPGLLAESAANVKPKIGRIREFFRRVSCIWLCT